MNVLLLHADDEIPQSPKHEPWDLVVDFGRAPRSTYERWAQAGVGRAVSLYDFAQEIEDLRRLRGLLGLGLGRMVDGDGIDWWDVISLMVVPGLLQSLLLQRIALEINPGSALYGSRLDPRFEALRGRMGTNLVILASSFEHARQRMQHYRRVFAHLDARTLIQVLQDKFDSQHSLRKRLARGGGARASGRSPGGRSLVLLPSAYINVSRTAVAYASILPGQRFLLALARRTGGLTQLPANVRAVSLDRYFGKGDEKELASLLGSWQELRTHLISANEEYAMANASGALAAVPRLLRWGTAVRRAWSRLYQSENITACLSADDSNPYSRIPLMLAKKQGIPALVCHHGALDCWAAVKSARADFYLAKNEMEHDYMVRIGGLPPNKIVVGAPQSSPPAETGVRSSQGSRRWLVFFTEPYGADGWRVDEVYRDLLPHLIDLADRCGVRLVFKVHPFENVPGHRRLLRRHLSARRLREIDILAGPITSRIWANTRFAMTVQSTVALECVAKGIPIFLCGWLRGSFDGYVREYEKFGIGRVLNSPEEIADIPRLLQEGGHTPLSENATWKGIDPRDLQNLLAGHSKPPVGAEELA